MAHRWALVAVLALGLAAATESDWASTASWSVEFGSREPAARQVHTRQADGQPPSVTAAESARWTWELELRRHLARYQALEQAAAFQAPLPARVVKPGETGGDLAGVFQRLIAIGDLDAAQPAPGEDEAYGGAVVGGVKRFQRRHGLADDGVIGRATLAALRVTPSMRARQIALALERVRSLPAPGQERLIAINIPMFQLWAWDAGADASTPALTARVIVGRAAGTETPLLSAVLERLVFSPFWNVPTSILRKEILPALKRDPGYLEDQNLEVVSGAGDQAGAVPFTEAVLAQLSEGTLRLRQRPGPSNSLGTVKFVIPNPHDVYLHGTAAPSLFALARRDLSHGCVRVQHPAALAAWLLRGQTGWEEERIAEAMKVGTPQTVVVERAVRVAIFYSTAWPLSDGSIHFAEDIYGMDGR